MSVITDRVPPVPSLVELVKKDKAERLMVGKDWNQWFIQIKYKIDSINQNLQQVSSVVGSGFAVRNPDGTWTTATIVPVGSGGTGINAVAAGNFLRGTGTEALEERTASEVLADIGAQPAFGSTHTSATAGTATALPATPSGYVDVDIGGGTIKRVPYYD